MTPKELTALVAGLDEYCKCSVMDTDTTKCAPCKAAAAIRALAGELDTARKAIKHNNVEAHKHRTLLLAANDSLRAEVERLKLDAAYCSEHHTLRQLADAERDTLRTEVAALRKDSERYRWMRDQEGSTDDQIDAEMAASKGLIS